MSTVKNKGSKIEKQIGSFLRKNGIKYRSHSNILPGKPDFYFRELKTVLFADSCFWHGCRYHGTQPKSNRTFWKKKIARNKKRDGEINRAYKKMDWHVIRVWEHSLKVKDADKKLNAALETLMGK